MPHTWVGTDFLHSFQSLLAFERDRDDALVLLAGVPDSWLTTPVASAGSGLRPEGADAQDRTGFGFARLPTPYGPITCVGETPVSGRRPGRNHDGAATSNRKQVCIKVSGLRCLPPGGVLLAPPLLRRASRGQVFILDFRSKSQE